MNGKSKCRHCGIEFKWVRAKTQKIPEYCSRECFSYSPKEWLKTRHAHLRDSEEARRENAKKRFEKHVIKKEGCWDWKGCEHHSGYLPFNYYGKKNSMAHIVSWRIHKGEIPEDMCVCHKCDNRRCTNPEHLFLGTHKQNIEDREVKLRGCHGEKSHYSKLNEDRVKEIKKLLILGVSCAKLARDYGVSDAAIWLIKQGQSWKHVTITPE